MSTSSNAIPESFGGPSAASEVFSATRPFYWSVRRELWEYRSLYIAPLIVAGVILLATTFSTFAGIWEPVLRLNPAQPFDKLAEPYNFAALLLMGTTLVVAIFYCLDALHGERRDRSILFWKSLPVSDWTAVLSKASIPLFVLPIITFAITLGTQLMMLVVGTLVLSVSSGNPGMLWRNLPFVQMAVMLFYHLLAVHGLWYAPFYGWLLLVSGWAKRAAFLWALIPLAAIAIVERIVFHSAYFLDLLGWRMMGGPDGNFPPPGNVLMPPMWHLTPGRFLISPGLWIGLGFTAICLALAVELRRQRGPV